MDARHYTTPREQDDMLRHYGGAFADRVDRVGGLCGWVFCFGLLAAILFL